MDFRVGGVAGLVGLLVNTSQQFVAGPGLNLHCIYLFLFFWNIKKPSQLTYICLCNRKAFLLLVPVFYSKKRHFFHFQPLKKLSR